MSADIASARAAIEAEAQERASQAAQEYNAAVTAIQERYNVRVLYVPAITPDGRIVANPTIAPL